MISKGVYCLTSPSGKRYVGIGLSKKGGINMRWSSYKRLKCKDQSKLYNALKKYGPENFIFEIILETNDVERAKNVEKQLIALWNLKNDKYGYNMTDGGDGSVGFKHSKETKDKISLTNKGKKRTEEYKRNMGIRFSKENHPCWGMKFSDERKMKMSKRMKKYYESHTSTFKGRTHTVEAKEKNRLAHLGKKPSQESINKRLAKLKYGYKIRKFINVQTGEIKETTFLKMKELFNVTTAIIYLNSTSKGWRMINE